jgi:DNA-binding Lrp family transcriptional regulator
MRPLFVQIKCELGKSEDVAEEIFKDVKEISELYSTSGNYDLLAKFHLAETDSIPQFINRQLHKIRGIRDTYTIVAFRLNDADSPEYGISRTPSARKE